MADLAGGIRTVIHDGNDLALNARLTVPPWMKRKKRKAARYAPRSNGIQRAADSRRQVR